jgi:hypothetical protein
MTFQVPRMAFFLNIVSAKLNNYYFSHSCYVCAHVSHNSYPILNADICDVPYRVDLKSIGRRSVSLLVLCKR